MSRCIACNVVLFSKAYQSLHDTDAYEDDLCSTCITASENTRDVTDYGWGDNPKDGLTSPTKDGYE